MKWAIGQLEGCKIKGNKEIICFAWILKSIFSSSESFCLITSHVFLFIHNIQTASSVVKKLFLLIEVNDNIIKALLYSARHREVTVKLYYMSLHCRIFIVLMLHTLVIACLQGMLDFLWRSLILFLVYCLIFTN